jgi:hypothetical protein
MAGLALGTLVFGILQLMGVHREGQGDAPTRTEKVKKP